MSAHPAAAAFTLDALQQTAEALLQTGPEAIVAFRLWRDVLRPSADNPAFQSLKAACYQSVWVRQLEDAQLADGTWGRLHSQDTRTKSTFRTTEEAIQRAVALGLDLSHPLLQRTREYLLNALAGRAAVSDPPENNERWPLLVQLILAGRLAQLDSSHPMLEAHWSYWFEVVQRAFASGSYRLEDEAAAYPVLSSLRAPQGFLESQYALWILSARPLPAHIDQAVVQWLWEKPDGIRYIAVGLQRPSARQIGLWFRSLDILTRFASWRIVAAEALNQLWGQRNERGLWDFGGEGVKSVELPLSTTWRKPGNRQADHSTWALALLRRYYG